MRLPLAIAALPLTLVLVACASLPPYAQPSPGPLTATLDVSRLGNVGPICTDGNQYALGAIKDRKIIVPATGRVGLYSFLIISDYNMNYTCHPGISFKPEPGQTYVLNMETESKGCMLEVYRKSDINRIGLDVESTAGPPQFCR